MIVYIDILKDSTTKYVEIICKYSKVEGYKINIQNFIVFLKIGNKQLENKILNMPYAIAPKHIKCIGLNLIINLCKSDSLKFIKYCREKLKIISVNGKLNQAHRLEDL